MATAKTLDEETSAGDRPQRPAMLPPGAPRSAVMPDVPDSAAVKRELEAERRRDEGAPHVPEGGLPDGIPHGDEGPGAKPHRSK